MATGLRKVVTHSNERMINLINFDTLASPPMTPGFFAGWSTVLHTITLIDLDHATSSGTNEFYKADGTHVQDRLLDRRIHAVRMMRPVGRVKVCRLILEARRAPPGLSP